jgi:flagellar basal-body rod modification protein FlgD
MSTTTSTVNPYSNLGVSALESSGESSGAAKKQSLGQEEFLKLMTAQLTHQDPSKPMENGDFLAQMAQFGTVSGIQDLQTSFKDFAASISSNQTLQAASLVGKYVSAPSEKGLLQSGGALKGKIELPESTTTGVNIKIIDATTGTVVRNMTLEGTHAAGSVDFEWDGVNNNKTLSSPGVYQIKAETIIGGKNTSLESTVQSQVESVSVGSSGTGIQVNLKGLGTVKFNDIKEIL